MREDLEQILADEFPFMRGKNLWTGKDTGYPIGCECSDGWYYLIYNLCKEIDQYYKSENVDVNTLYVEQVKEKFGQLQFYIGNYIGGIDEIINKYEKLSLETCEICGNKGKLMINSSWYRTLCNKHAEEYNYKNLNRSNDYV